LDNGLSLEAAQEIIDECDDQKDLEAEVQRLCDKINQQGKKIQSLENQSVNKKTGHHEFERKYNALMDTSPHGIFVADENGQYLEVNQAAEELTGYRRDELLEMKIMDLVPPDNREQLQEKIAATLQQDNSSLTVPFQTKDKEIRTWQVRVSELPNGNFLGITTDVTEREKRKKELQFKESAFDSAHGGIGFCDLDGRIIEINRSMVKMWGFDTEKKLLGRRVEHLYEEPEEVRELFQQFDEQDEWMEELTARRPGGETFEVQVTASKIYDSEGTPLGIMAHHLDITQKLERTAELRKLNRAIEQSPAVVVITDKSGTIEYVNPRFTEVTGYPVEEVIGEDPSVLKSGYQDTYYYWNLWFTIKGGETWAGEFHNQTRNGDYYWEQARISPILNGEGDVTHFVKVAEDFTEQRRDRKNLEALTNTFLNFGEEPEKNIDRLTELLANISGLDIIFYNRIEEGKMWVKSSCNLPPKNPKSDQAEGHICNELVQREEQDLVVIDDLQNSKYIETDPWLEGSDLQTYAGLVIYRHSEPLGTLCGVSTDKVHLDTETQNLFKVIAKALAIEEERSLALEKLWQSKDRLDAQVQQLDAANQQLKATEQQLRAEVEERKKTEQELASQNQLLEGIINAIPDVLAIQDSDHTIRRYNRKGYELLGKTPEEVKGKKCFELLGRTEPCEVCATKKAREKKELVEIEKYVPELETYWSCRSNPILDDEGNILYIVEQLRDITDYEEAIASLEKALKEKETLLQEVHHRVKNNLQVVSSLLNLQKFEIMEKADDEIIEAFETSRSRVHAMAQVHDQLYRSEHLETVETDRYFRNLTKAIVRSYDLQLVPQINFQINDQVEMNFDEAIHCGLILNELLANALEHAFEGVSKPRFWIEIDETEDEIIFVVRDNGTGVPEDFDLAQTDSLGLQLAQSLAEDQLQGRFEFQSNETTEFKIYFPKPEIN